MLTFSSQIALANPTSINTKQFKTVGSLLSSNGKNSKKTSKGKGSSMGKEVSEKGEFNDQAVDALIEFSQEEIDDVLLNAQNTTHFKLYYYGHEVIRSGSSDEENYKGAISRLSRKRSDLTKSISLGMQKDSPKYLLDKYTISYDGSSLKILPAHFRSPDADSLMRIPGNSITNSICLYSRCKYHKYIGIISMNPKMETEMHIFRELDKGDPRVAWTLHEAVQLQLKSSADNDIF